MKTNAIAVLVAATMIAMSLAPMASAVPAKSCFKVAPPPGAADHDPHDLPDNSDGACGTIAGPASIDIKGVVGAGIGFCHSGLPPGLPLDCANPPGAISGAGAFIVNTAGCTAPAIISGCIYDVWVIQVGGVEGTGWGITVCTDRNDNDICTNIPADEGDDFGEGYKGEEISGASKETKCTKYPGTPDCDDWAHAQFCVRQDIGATGYDDMWVFITDWVDVGWGGNIGTGLSVGLYDVFVEYKADAASAAACAATHSIHSAIP